MRLYEALYNCMIHESSSATLSLHRTKEGAEKAIEEHKAEIKKEWEDRRENMRKTETKEMYDAFHSSDEPDQWAVFQWWGVSGIEVQE